MQKKNKGVKSNENGAITLFVLLACLFFTFVLVGVYISNLNKIQTQDQQIKQIQENYSKDNNRIEEIYDEYIKLKPGEVATKTIKNNYTDGVDYATIPKGFRVSSQKDEQTISTGLVIIDDTNGNEFVWIPCTETEYTSAKDDVMDNHWSSNNEYKDNGNTSGSATTAGTGNGLGWRDTYTPDDKTMLEKTYSNNLPTDNWVAENQIEKGQNSIKTYGGFYIARFEAGIPSGATFYTTEAATYNRTGRGNTSETSSIKGYKPVSKKGVQAWNFITQPNSKMVAENMYDADSSVDSFLVDSQAWNVICNKFNGILGSSDTEKTITNSVKWGNYWNNKTTDYTKINCLYARHEWNGSAWDYAKKYEKGLIPDNTAPKGTGNNRLELATGASDDFKVYNIYDMAGNMWEWTTSHTIKGENMFVVPRGGSSFSDGATESVVHANGWDVLTSCDFSIGFRVVLYVNYE